MKTSDGYTVITSDELPVSTKSLDFYNYPLNYTMSTQKTYTVVIDQ